jgi:hypothetical protein
VGLGLGYRALVLRQVLRFGIGILKLPLFLVASTLDFGLGRDEGEG